MGHTSLTHSCLMNSSLAPFYGDCMVPLTVHHILLECLIYPFESRSVLLQVLLECPTYEHQIRRMGNNSTMKSIFEKYSEFCGPLYRFCIKISFNNSLKVFYNICWTIVKAFNYGINLSAKVLIIQFINTEISFFIHYYLSLITIFNHFLKLWFPPRVCGDNPFDGGGGQSGGARARRGGRSAKEEARHYEGKDLHKLAAGGECGNC